MQDMNVFNLQLYALILFWYFKHKTLNTDIWNYFKKWKETLNVN